MTWVSDGQCVWFPLEEIREGASRVRRLVVGTVACAMGDKARVVSEEYGVDTWFEVSELEEAKEPHGTEA